jgi:SAM-dependent methyltransferase
MKEEVQLNKYNFYELKHKPSLTELEEYYSLKYYQDNKGSYEVTYTDNELRYFTNKNEEKFWVINQLIGNSLTNKRLLDIGCGEGFTLKFFKEKGWEIKGIDYSDYGCKKHNPDCLYSLLTGDIHEQMLPLIDGNSKFEVVWLDNVLEHVLDPLSLLITCKKLLSPNGVLVVEVQNYLMENGCIDKEFWVVVPDHISYFNKEGLTSLAKEAGLENKITIGDHPIDFNLINPEANYVKDRSKGKNAHQTRVNLDNLLHSISIEKTVNYYKALADLGLGRQIISFLTIA